jgi:hypothetical protein
MMTTGPPVSGVRFCRLLAKRRHRVIDLATLLDGTKSRERFNAGG